MLLRHFYAGTQSYSRNRISGNPASQHVYHEPIATFSESHNERAYRSYVVMCSRLEILPLNFMAWSRLSDGAESPHEDVLASRGFHKHSGDLVRPELEDHLTGRSRGVKVAPVYDVCSGHARPDAHVIISLGGRE